MVVDKEDCFRGTFLEGIGVRQEGRYPRVLKDEMGLDRKRGFSNTHHGFARGLDSIGISTVDSPAISYQPKQGAVPS